MLDQLRAHLSGRYLQDDKRWIVLFPEGGFLYKRRGRSQKYVCWWFYKNSYLTESENLPVTNKLHVQT